MSGKSWIIRHNWGDGYLEALVPEPRAGTQSWVPTTEVARKLRVVIPPPVSVSYRWVEEVAAVAGAVSRVPFWRKLRRR